MTQMLQICRESLNSSNAHFTIFVSPEARKLVPMKVVCELHCESGVREIDECITQVESGMAINWHIEKVETLALREAPLDNSLPQ